MPRVSAADRRSDFVKAAVEVIAEHGIDGATTRRIAEEAKAPLATLHYCYNSKEDLFADVYSFVADRFKQIGLEIEAQRDVPETARRLLRGVMECYLESVSFAATTLELVSWARRQHGDKGIGIYDEALEVLRGLLRDADAEHVLTSDDVDEFAYVIATLADGFALNWLTYGDPSAAQEQMAVVASVLDAWVSARLAAPVIVA